MPMHRLLILASTLLAAPAALADHTKNILITGYWPPTNEMVRQFSTNKDRNPGGWRGFNWEGSGFNIHSYFPEFPGVTPPNYGQGTGDFEVDYQDTDNDWKRIFNEIRPVAIITFSRANTSIGWEMEPAAQRFRLPGEPAHPTRTIPFYTQDYSGVRYPSDCTIALEPLGNIRESTLPMSQIVTNVAASVDARLVSPFIAAYNPSNPDAYDFGGSFLSGYMSYLGVWYQNLHAAPNDPSRCVAAGHIHVGQGMNVAAATLATEVTLRTLIAHVNTILLPSPGGAGLLGVVLAASACGRRRRGGATRRVS